MVAYQGTKRWNAATNLHDLLTIPEYFKPFRPQLSHGLMDLPAFGDEVIKRCGAFVFFSERTHNSKYLL